MLPEWVTSVERETMEGNWKSNGIRIPMSRDDAKQGYVFSRRNGGSCMEFQISDPSSEIKMIPPREYT